MARRKPCTLGASRGTIDIRRLICRKPDWPVGNDRARGIAVLDGGRHSNGPARASPA